MSGPFEPFDLDSYEARPHDWLEPGIVARGCTTLLHGEPGCGKTWLALAIAKQVIDSDDMALVVFVDLESGPWLAQKRVRALGLNTGSLIYLPVAPVTIANAPAFVEFIEANMPDLVIFDSQANSLAAANIGENDNMLVTQWWQAYLHPITRQLGAAAIVIDHDVKSGANGYARGAGAKKAQTDFDFSVHAAQPFNRDRLGLITLKSQKPGGRTGDAADNAAFKLGGAAGAFVCERIEGESASDRQLSGLEARVLELVGAEADGTTHGDIRKAIPQASEPTIRRARNELLRRNLIRSEGSGRDTRYVVARTNADG